MYITDVVTLPRFCFGRGVYRRFPELCKGLGARFALVGGNTAMEKGLPSLKEGLEGSGMQLLCAPSAALAVRMLYGADARCGRIFHGMGGGKAIDTAKGVAHRLDSAGQPPTRSPIADHRASVVYREDAFDASFLRAARAHADRPESGG
ncbi:MAG: iron-containing alcohol dehydrogenase [Christensenellales bacterium]